MEFALTRKQLNKKRTGDPGASSPAPTMPGAPPGHGVGTHQGGGIDPITGLPNGYQPAPTFQPNGAEFFSSGAPGPGKHLASPSPVPGPAYAPLVPDYPPPAPAGYDPFAQFTQYTSGPTEAPVPASNRRSAHRAALVEGERPRGADFVMSMVMRYAGFVLFVVVAILLIEFLPSLRHSSGSSMGPGLSTLHASASASASASTGPTGHVAWGAGVAGVSASYV